jgi:pimeloyl-ACP methyl ester carboxylesterase
VAALGSRARAALCALALGALVPWSLGVAAPSVARAQPPVPAPHHELVVLVHGMGRSTLSMRPLARALEGEGYDVLRFGYSSLCCSIPELGAKLERAVRERMTDDVVAVHFVGHSLGNILVRWVLTRDTLPPRVGRVVMLAPPNQGSSAADRYAGVAGWLLKPIDGLRTDSLAAVRLLPPVEGVEIGVISARDDRTVRLTETHLPEETAHIVVGGGHTFIMRRADTIARTLEFLRTGAFSLTGPVVVDP